MREITEEERICAVERSRRMYQTDMQSNWATARDQGRQECREEGREDGREEGREEKSFEIARNLIQMGLSFEQIKEATGLSLEEVKRLAEN